MSNLHACHFHAHKGGLKQGLWASESLIADSDNLPVR
jgi:hypothetical protein